MVGRHSSVGARAVLGLRVPAPPVRLYRKRHARAETRRRAPLVRVWDRSIPRVLLLRPWLESCPPNTPPVKPNTPPAKVTRVEVLPTRADACRCHPWNSRSPCFVPFALLASFSLDKAPFFDVGVLQLAREKLCCAYRLLRTDTLTHASRTRGPAPRAYPVARWGAVPFIAAPSAGGEPLAPSPPTSLMSEVFLPPGSRCAMSRECRKR